MYSWEIDNIIKQFNYNLPSEEYVRICRSEQVCRVHYDPFSNDFEVWTSDGYNWKFQVHR